MKTIHKELIAIKQDTKKRQQAKNHMLLLVKMIVMKTNLTDG